MILPLKNVYGIQYNNGMSIQFRWDQPEQQMANLFVWIYQNGVFSPFMRAYNGINQIDYPMVNSYNVYNIEKIDFLVFASNSTIPPSDEEMYQICQNSDFICSVFCGECKVEWSWIKDEHGMVLYLNSEKEIPEGLLYYEYYYGGQQIRFKIPDPIRRGENYYPRVFFPGEKPIVCCKGNNVSLTEVAIKKSFFSKLKNKITKKGAK